MGLFHTLAEWYLPLELCDLLMNFPIGLDGSRDPMSGVYIVRLCAGNLGSLSLDFAPAVAVSSLLRTWLGIRNSTDLLGKEDVSSQGKDFKK